MTRAPVQPVFAPLGDSAIMVTLGDSVERALNRRVHACVAGVRNAALAGVLDVVPAYASFAVHYDARDVDAAAIIASLREIVSGSMDDDQFEEDGRLVTIPVRYDGADLAAVAEATGLTAEDVVARHVSVEYYVYMLGFSPGFAYLGDLDPALCLPRRELPRTRVPRGSVAIAGSQTAVYPQETPGGWHLIGTTELAMFDAGRDPPSLLRSGDRVRFQPIA